MNVLLGDAVIRGWFDPSTLAVFVLGVALLLLAGTGGLVRFTPLFGRHTGEQLKPSAIKVTATLGVLCVLVSAGIELPSWIEKISIKTHDPTSSISPPVPTPIITPDPTPSPTTTTPITPTSTSPTSSTPPTSESLPLPPSKTYLQALSPLGSPNVLNRNPSLKMNKFPYTHSIEVACVTGEPAGVVYAVSDYSKLHVTLGLNDADNGPGRADGIPCEVSITNNADGDLKTLTIKPGGSPQELDIDLRGAVQMKITCIPEGKTRSGNDVNYKIGFGNAELS
ncbi:hypothetical protein [Amycolatopsis sp. H20-H5]|uniref:hypothetical protein n=1 Tax=Amycolatopsis sp. H20-H5 TaxID=3046309 RepID=UPI002DB5BE22|nr:hypothetical protein [Amycolatopsis sp. H20-H5]MEC3978139.1 hypothetical protein [Amycolatopsis sp. H20-H5]